MSSQQRLKKAMNGLRRGRTLARNLVNDAII
jgi:ribosomal protein S17E